MRTLEEKLAIIEELSQPTGRLGGSGGTQAWHQGEPGVRLAAPALLRPAGDPTPRQAGAATAGEDHHPNVNAGRTIGSAHSEQARPPSERRR